MGCKNIAVLNYLASYKSTARIIKKSEAGKLSVERLWIELKQKWYLRGKFKFYE